MQTYPPTEGVKLASLLNRCLVLSIHLLCCMYGFRRSSPLLTKKNVTPAIHYCPKLLLYNISAEHDTNGMCNIELCTKSRLEAFMEFYFIFERLRYGKGFRGFLPLHCQGYRWQKNVYKFLNNTIPF